MKQKAETYKKKRIVMGDENLVTNSEIHIKDVVKDLYGDAPSGGDGASQMEYWSFPDGMPAEITEVAMFSTLAKFNFGSLQILPTAIAFAFGVMEFSAIALDLNLVVSGDTGFATLGERLAGFDLAAVGGISITKEQFYTI